MSAIETTSTATPATPQQQQTPPTVNPQQNMAYNPYSMYPMQQYYGGGFPQMMYPPQMYPGFPGFEQPEGDKIAKTDEETVLQEGEAAAADPSTADTTRPSSPNTLTNTPQAKQLKQLDQAVMGQQMHMPPMGQEGEQQMQQMQQMGYPMYPYHPMGYPMHHPYGHPQMHMHTPRQQATPQKQNSEKRKRTQLPEASLTLLQNAFSHNKFPSPTQRNELAEDLSVTPKVVQNWFQNQRQIYKRSMEEQGYSVPRGHGLRGDLDTAWYEEQFKKIEHVDAADVDAPVRGVQLARSDE